MTNIVLSAKKRGKEENVRTLRVSGFIPAVMYGSKKETQSIKLNKVEFEKINTKAGGSNLIDLKIGDNAPTKVLIKEIQKDVVKGSITHADLFQVDMDQTITTEIPFNFIGEPRAIKELNGVFVKNMDSVEIECLPGALINAINVDVTELANFNDSVTLRDLNLPEGIKLLTEELDTVVAQIMQPRIQEEEEKSDKDEAEDAGEEKTEGDAKSTDGEEKTSDDKANNEESK